MKFIIALTLLALFAGIECQVFVAPGYTSPFATYTGSGMQGLYYGGAPVMMAARMAPVGKYVAKTPGAEHAAPLEGHMKSAFAFNMDPAPGTM